MSVHIYWLQRLLLFPGWLQKLSEQFGGHAVDHAIKVIMRIYVTYCTRLAGHTFLSSHPIPYHGYTGKEVEWARRIHQKDLQIQHMFLGREDEMQTPDLLLGTYSLQKIDYMYI